MDAVGPVARACPRWAVVVVLPTPPLWWTTAVHGPVPFGLVGMVNMTRVCGNGQLMELPVVGTRGGGNARLYIRADVWRNVVNASERGRSAHWPCASVGMTDRCLCAPGE